MSFRAHAITSGTTFSHWKSSNTNEHLTDNASLRAVVAIKAIPQNAKLPENFNSPILTQL